MPSNRWTDKEAELHDGTTLTSVGANLSSDTHDLGAGRVAPGTSVAINVSALDFGDANETYRAEIQATDDDFSTNTVVGCVEIAAIGNYEVPFMNVQGTTPVIYYNRIRLNFITAGTTPSITATAGVTGVFDA